MPCAKPESSPGGSNRETGLIVSNEPHGHLGVASSSATAMANKSPVAPQTLLSWVRELFIRRRRVRCRRPTRGRWRRRRSSACTSPSSRRRLGAVAFSSLIGESNCTPLLAARRVAAPKKMAPLPFLGASCGVRSAMCNLTKVMSVSGREALARSRRHREQRPETFTGTLAINPAWFPEGIPAELQAMDGRPVR